MNDQPVLQEQIDLRSYLRPIWRHKVIILLITILAAGAAYELAARQKKSYTARTSLYVQDANPTEDMLSPGQEGPPTSTELANLAQLMTAPATTKVVTRKLGASAGSVNITPSTTSSFINITAASHSPTMAARLANTYAKAFLRSQKRAVAGYARVQLKTAQTALASIPKGTLDGTAQGQTLVQQIDAYSQVVLNPPAGATQVSTATVPRAPSSPRPKRDAIFGGIVGLVLGLIVAFCLELLDRTLIAVGTVESMFRRPVLAVLPHVGDPTPPLKSKRPSVPPEFVEALRSLTVVLRLGSEFDQPRMIMVTSALPQEGKSTVTRDLALVYAESGKRVLVIDGDLRRPSMERLFSVEADCGLVHVLREEATLAEAAVSAVGGPGLRHRSSNGRAKTPENGRATVAAKGAGVGRFGSIDVLTHGEVMESPLALLSSDPMMELMARAPEAYDIVLLDTPPVLAVADAVPLLEVVDSVLLVVRLGNTTRHAARQFGHLIENLSNVNFSGVIANDRKEGSDDGYSSYRYGAKYGYVGRSRGSEFEEEVEPVTGDEAEPVTGDAESGLSDEAEPVTSDEESGSSDEDVDPSKPSTSAPIS